MTSELILLVDDEPSIVSLLRMYLERENFRVETSGDGEHALEAVKLLKPTLVVLDVMLPGLDGFEVCRRIRADDEKMAIMMLTARDEDIDKIIGLELGADDYLTKPFNPRELVARVKALLRRVERNGSGTSGVVRLADLILDPERREVHCGTRRVDLRTQEFELLQVLIHQPGRVFTREQLLEKGWGFDFFGQTRTVDVHIAHLRKRLEGCTCRIETVTGIGYKLVAQ
jgi:two-component system, OmpR family, alkaline phosphatase synthesis response regulator PhoP